MSYVKAMKHANNVRKAKYTQPVLGMPFKEGERVESYASVAHRTVESYHVKALNVECGLWERVSIDYITENEAIDESYKYDTQGFRTRIYSDKDMVIAGW